MVFESLFHQKKKRDDAKVSQPQASVKSSAIISTTPNSTIHKNTPNHCIQNQESHQKKKKKRPPKQKKNPNHIVSKQQQHHHHNSKPSAEAIQLSSKLKEYSTQKRFKECLEMFWAKENDPIRDGHHTCIVVDCCARCGDIQMGEDIVKRMQKEGQKINVQTNTSLLKGYCHSGLLHKAFDLYHRMVQSKDSKDRPNVRTFNTLLRGCMWSAAQLEEGRVEGGTVTSEKIWNSLGRIQQEPDMSSYEYSIALLTQSLHCDIAENRIEEFCQRFEVTSQSIKGGKHRQYHATHDTFSCLETLAVSYLNLSKAYALLKNHGQSKIFAEKSLDVISSARFVQKSTENENSASIGGKRAFRAEHHGGRREESNAIFRAHKLGELENDANVILAYIRKKGSSASNISLASTLARKIIATDGGGTTDLMAIQGSSTMNPTEPSYSTEEEICKLLNSLWISFGLSSAIQLEFPNEHFPGDLQKLSKQDCDKILQLLEMDPLYILHENGSVDFQKVFDKSGNSSQSLCIELGSGFGEWAAYQAKCNPTNNYVAVEMRSDRVGQTFCKAFLSDHESPLRNLCCVGAECGSFLRNRVKEGCVSKIFVNHPEPPTQTYGTNVHILSDIADGGEEPAHMLASETLISAAHCLEKNGEIIIVTDNRWYANLICSTVMKVLKSHKGLMYSKKIHNGLRCLEVFRGSDDNVEEVILYEGQPGPIIGHAAVHQSGSTYFDRLWRKGGGSHADIKSRFIICLQRSRTIEGKGNNTIPHRSVEEREMTSKRKRSNKRSAAKQQRRNERRLLKKAKLGE